MTSGDSMSNMNEVTVLKILQHVSFKAILLHLLCVSMCYLEDLMQTFNSRCRVLYSRTSQLRPPMGPVEVQ